MAHEKGHTDPISQYELESEDKGGTGITRDTFFGDEWYGRYIVNADGSTEFLGPLPMPIGQWITDEERDLAHQRDLELRRTPTSSFSSSSPTSSPPYGSLYPP